MEEGRGPKVQESQCLWVQRSKGPEDQDISNSNSKNELDSKGGPSCFTYRLVTDRQMDMVLDKLLSRLKRRKYW